VDGVGSPPTVSALKLYCSQALVNEKFKKNERNKAASLAESGEASAELLGQAA